MKETKKNVKWLAISIILMILGCCIASAINTNFNSVDVSEFSFSTERGSLSAYLYMPKGAGTDNPRPVIVLTHGYMNSKEMQDSAAVEMSRRGYIVVVVDQYDHGLSRWEADIPNGTEFTTFGTWSMYDTVNYVYNQDYTLKDEQGNGYIGCSGHSFGGLSTLFAMYFDEQQALESGHRMIYCGLNQGADFSFITLQAPLEDVFAAYGDRTYGVIAGHYDEFNFGDTMGMYYKDFINDSTIGAQFLGLGEDEIGKSGKFYEVESGEVIKDGNVVRESQTAKHVIYLVDELHAKVHFSIKSTSHLIDFFQTAFKDVVTSDMVLADMTSSNQVWTFKELGNLIALIGFFLFFVPFISLITKVKFFKNAITEKNEVIPLPSAVGGKIAYGLLTVVFVLSPAVLYVSLMDNKPADIRVLEIIMAFVVAIMLIVGIIFKIKASKDTTGKFESYARGGFVAAAFSVLMIIALFASPLFKLNPYFNSTSTNWSVYWSFIMAFILIIMTVSSYYFINKPRGISIKSYGLIVGLKNVLSAFVTAVSAFAAGYLILFILDAVFNVDFRFWSLGVKVFNTEYFITMLKYLPFFFLFYFILSVILNANNRAFKHSYLISILSTAGGCALWLLVQYGAFYITGTGFWPVDGTITIGMYSTIPLLIVTAIFTRKIYDKTNNVWTAGFFNALLFTMITVANTLLHWNLV